MPTYLLNWSPQRFSWDRYAETVTRTRLGEAVPDRWSTGNRRTLASGSRLYLVRSGSDRGIVASGVASSDGYSDEHWQEGARGPANFVNVVWDTVLSVGDELPLEVLTNANLGVPWARLQASGVKVPDESVEALEHQWITHLNQLGRNRPFDVLPNEIPATHAYREGAVRVVQVNAFERNPIARRKCIDHYGPKCSVCGFVFEEAYGDAAAGFIHVHHLQDLASIGHQYEVDPIADLRPVCPNCHAMLHWLPNMTIERLKQLVTQSTGLG